MLHGHSDSVVSAAFSPDGTRIVTASWDKTARIWDVAAGKEIAVLRGSEDALVSAAFSPDGSHIVTASTDGTERIWDAGTAKETALLGGYEASVNSVAFSPEGSSILTASSDTTARICPRFSSNSPPSRARIMRPRENGEFDFSRVTSRCRFRHRMYDECPACDGPPPDPPERRPLEKWGI